MEIPGGNGVIAVQDRVKQVYYDEILPKLDVLFSGLVTNETIIRIDKLDVDLGKIDKERLGQQLVEKTINNIERQLKEKLQFDANTSNDVNIISERQSVGEELLHFLDHGYFSWISQTNEMAILEKALMKEKITLSTLKDRLNKIVKEKPFVRDRLVFQFSDTFLQFLVQFFIPGFLAKDLLKTINNTFANVSEQNKIDTRNYFWRVVFSNLSMPNHDAQMNVLSATIRFVASIQNTSDDEVLSLLDKTRISANVLNQLEKVFGGKSKGGNSTTITPPVKNKLDNNAVEDEISNDGSEGTANNSNNNNAAFKNLPTSVSITINETDATNFNDRKTANDQIPGGEAIYIELVGLIILHNFLVPFFDTLLLLENKRFRSEEALHKAVQLTGYLATGETCIEESYLILPKLLCGMELTASIQKEIVISNEEKREAESLLKQVIGYWAALKNTSPEGLRNTFLKREGKLSRGGLGWQLEVEHKTWDILLAKLPWGYSLIKLPWMKEFLFVNWV